MKRILAILMILAMVISLSACGNEEYDGINQPSSSGDTTAAATGDTDSQSAHVPEVTDTSDDNGEPVEDGPQEETAPEEPAEEVVNQSSILVAYFSRVGNTDWEDGVDAVSSASINIRNGEFYGNAQLLAQFAQEVTGGDLFLIETVEKYPSAYRATTDKAADEQDNDARPELASHVENMDGYDTVILIYPNWWGTLPQAVMTFLEEYDFSGKTILPLCTHEGSRMGSSEKDIKKLCPDVTLLDGLDIRGSKAPTAQDDVEKWINKSGILG